jgi:hypothetical protein
MHSSLGVSELMPFGQSYAGLESLSAYRASVVQHMRTRQRAQDVGSMIILLVFHSQRPGGEFAAKRGEFFAERRRDYIASSRGGYTTAALDRIALQPAHEPYRHNGSSRAATVLPRPKRVFPVLYEVRYRKLARRHCRPSQQEIKC